MAQQELNRARGTRCRGDHENGYVLFHDTMVANWSDMEIRLSTGGFQTPSTKRRMNQAAEVFQLGYHVYQDGYSFYASYKGEKYRFNGDGRLTLRRVHGTL